MVRRSRRPSRGETGCYRSAIDFAPEITISNDDIVVQIYYSPTMRSLVVDYGSIP